MRRHALRYRQTEYSTEHLVNGSVRPSPGSVTRGAVGSACLGRTAARWARRLDRGAVACPWQGELPRSTTFAEFEVDLLRMRPREGMTVAKAKGKLKGKQPKLNARQQAHLLKEHATGDYTIADLAELYSVSRATVYRVLERARPTT